MKLGVNLGYFCKDRPEIPFEKLCGTALTLRDHGFSQLDFLTDVTRPDWEDHAKAFRDFADVASITVHQTHAPFNRYEQKRTMDEFLVLVDRAVEVSSILGAKYMVLHADEYRLPKGEAWDVPKVRQEMYDYAAPIVEKAKKLGVGVAMENLFEENVYGTPRSRYCSTLEELLSLIDMFHDPAVSCCWDFGHGKCAFDEASLENFKSALPYITCTHVHDNTHGDNHLVPFFGNLDWDSHIRAMKDAGYAGNFTYELVYGHIPEAILGSFLDYIGSVGQYILSR